MAVAVVLSIAATALAQDRPKVEYGTVDASTVRVFAIGSVDVESLAVRGHTIHIARPKAGHGSGFVVGQGVIATAHHVIEGARHIVVRLPADGGFYSARLVYDEEDADLALLHIDASPAPLAVAADVSLRVRQTVFAVGYPLDPARKHAQSARGIVAGHLEDDTLQLDMSLNPGNSGGPLVDEQDRVVGMVVARGNVDAGVQGIGYAVNASRIARAVAEAERRLAAGQVAALTDAQKASGVVVDELVQQGVFHELEKKDFKKGIRTADVEEALDNLASRTTDPDLLVFIAGHLWNTSLALWAADDEDLRRVKLSRGQARDLSRRFGRAAADACRKAFAADRDVSKRSPLVAIASSAFTEPEERPAARPAAGAAPSGRVWQSRGRPIDFPDMTLTIRGAVHLRLNPPSGSLGVGGGFGVALALDDADFHLAGRRVLPRLGLAYGTVDLESADATVTHSFIAAEIALTAEMWKRGRHRVEVDVAWTPASYQITIPAGPGWQAVDDTEITAANFRLAAGYRWRGLYAGVAIQSFEGQTYWFEPITVAVVF